MYNIISIANEGAKMNIKKLIIGIIITILIAIVIFQNKNRNISQTNIQQVKKEEQIEKQEINNYSDSYNTIDYSYDTMPSTTQEKANQQSFYQGNNFQNINEISSYQHFPSLIFDTNGSDDLASLKSEDCKKIYNNNPKKLISPFLISPQDLDNLWVKTPKVMTSIMSYLMCQYYIDKDDNYFSFVSDIDIDIAYLDFVNDIVNTKKVNPEKCNKWLSLSFREEKGKGSSTKICNMIKDAIISRSSDEICNNSPNPNRCNFDFLFLKGKKYCKNILINYPHKSKRNSKFAETIAINKAILECETLSDLVYNNSNSWLSNVLKSKNPMACESLAKDMINNVCSESFLSTLGDMKIQKTKQRKSLTVDQSKNRKNDRVDEEEK
jgi:predicted small secreted protein